MALGWRNQYYRYKDFFLNVLNLYKRRSDLRAFLEIILSLATVIIFFVFALKPTALTIISLYNEIKEKEETVTILDEKISNLQTANGIFSQNQSVIPNIETSVPDRANPGTVTKQIYGLAAKNGVNLMGVSIGEVVLTGSVPSRRSSQNLKELPEGSRGMPISISIRGSYVSLIAFIKDLENLRITIVTDILGINTSATEEGSDIVAVVSGRVPFLQEP